MRLPVARLITVRDLHGLQQVALHDLGGFEADSQPQYLGGADGERLASCPGAIVERFRRRRKECQGGLGVPGRQQQHGESAAVSSGPGNGPLVAPPSRIHLRVRHHHGLPGRPGLQPRPFRESVLQAVQKPGLGVAGGQDHRPAGRANRTEHSTSRPVSAEANSAARAESWRRKSSSTSFSSNRSCRRSDSRVLNINPPQAFLWPLEVVLQLLLGFPAPAGHIAQFPGGLGSRRNERLVRFGLLALAGRRSLRIVFVAHIRMLPRGSGGK